MRSAQYSAARCRNVFAVRSVPFPLTRRKRSKRFRRVRGNGTTSEHFALDTLPTLLLTPSVLLNKSPNVHNNELVIF